jgi:glycerophosphoryl diester phosphodiesterase
MLAHQWSDPADPMLPLLSSFSFEALVSAKAVAPALPCGWLVERIPADWQVRLRRLGAVALHANHRFLTREAVQEIKAVGVGLFCYTVDEPERAAQLFGWGVDAVCTNRLDLIDAGFGERCSAYVP